MIKKSLLSVSLFMAVASAYAEGPVAPQFGEFQIEVIKAGKMLYAATTVLGPTANSVAIDSVHTLPMEVTCQPNFTINPSLTYKEGIKLELNASIHKGQAYGFFGFEIEAPSAPEPEAPFGQGCRARLVISHNFGSSGGKILRVGEQSITRIDELEVKLTLKQVFDSFPSGKPVGKIIRG